ncbi:MAG: alkylmercury lyase family protein [Pseudomonadota bacterium]
MSVTTALAQLNSLLPLAAHQTALAPALQSLHRDILRGFAERGLPPTRAEIAARPDIGDVDAALARLAGDDLVVLDTAGGGVTGAYPFTTEARVHRVQVGGHTVHAMCALDALSVAPMFGVETRIDSRCHVSGQAIAIHMRGADVLTAQPPAPWLGIRWQATSGCAAQSLCLEMVFLRDGATAAAWRAEDPDHISIFDLPDAVAFGAAFFRPLLG